MANTHAIQHLDIHDADPTVWEQGGTIGLSVPAPICQGDSSRVAIYFAGPERLRKLRDDIDALLARLGEAS